MWFSFFPHYGWILNVLPSPSLGTGITTDSLIVGGKQRVAGPLGVLLELCLPLVGPHRACILRKGRARALPRMDK